MFMAVSLVVGGLGSAARIQPFAASTAFVTDDFEHEIVSEKSPGRRCNKTAGEPN
jgi:hypothetical protein